MSPSKPPPPHDHPDAKEDLLAQFADEKTHVQPGRDGTINYRSPYAMAAMAFGGPLRIPRKEDAQYEGSLPPPSYSTATGRPEGTASSKKNGKRTNALGNVIEDSGGIGGWWERKKERKEKAKAEAGKGIVQ